MTASKTKTHSTEKNSETKNVIGLVYAEWCGHCQALKPEWEKMEEFMKGDATCDVVTIESENKPEIDNLNARLDGDRLEVNGYPTIFYIYGQTKKLQMYTGGRTADALITWAKNGGKPILGGRRKKRTKSGRTKKNKRVRKTVRFYF